MKHIFLAACLFFAMQVSAQGSNDTVKKPKPQVFTYVEQMPRAPYDLAQYLGSHLHYPDNARKKNIEGRVIVKFVVSEKGEIQDVTLMRGIDEDCDAEALKVIKNMPPWAPGTQNGKPVSVYFTQPINFRLETAISSQQLKDQKPHPPYDILKYLDDNLRYPDAALESKLMGRVLVQFSVNEDGSLSDFKLLKGIGSGCDEEAMRVAKKMPNWFPGIENGKPVKMTYRIPVQFTLP